MRLLCRFDKTAALQLCTSGNHKHNSSTDKGANINFTLGETAKILTHSQM